MALTKIATDGVKDDAITSGKIPANAVGSSEIADQAVTLDKLPHGTSSTNGKFLRANNGADPSFEDVPPGGISDVVSDTSPQLGGNLDTNSFEISLDDGHAVKFGDGSDMTVYHTGSAGYVANSTGNMIIQSDAFRVYNGNGSHDMIQANNGGSVSLYHNNTKQCETSANGLAFPSGKGIDFSATSGSGTSELLDDYEEGTWTPSPENLSNTPTYYNQQGKYVKIGSFVTIWGFIQVGNTIPTFNNDTQHLHIAGLPFAANDTTGYVAGVGLTTHQNFYWRGSTYNDYGANGPCFCGVTNSTRTMFQVLADVNNGIRGTLRRKSLSASRPILTWTISYRTTA